MGRTDPCQGCLQLQVGVVGHMLSAPICGGMAVVICGNGVFLNRGDCAFRDTDSLSLSLSAKQGMMLGDEPRPSLVRPIRHSQFTIHARLNAINL